MSAEREQLQRAAALEQGAAAALDERARREALDPRRSLLLQAPAGSGKTTVLTARFLALLATVQVPEEIVAITFTRKAAAEMRQRVLAALRADPADHVPRGIDARLLETVRRRDQQLRWELKDNPSRLRIQTVDALNHWLAQALPVAAQSAPALQIADAPATLYQLAARRCLQDAWSDPQLQPSAQLLFARLDNGWSRLEALLAEMLACRSHWLPRLLRASGEGLSVCIRRSLDSIVRSGLVRVRAQLPQALLEEGCRLLAQGEGLRSSASPPGQEPASDAHPTLSADVAELPRWRALVDLARTLTDWRRSFTQAQGFAPKAKALKQRAVAWVAALRGVPDAETLLEYVRALPDPELAAADERALEALAPLLKRAAAELKLVFAERGRVDHSEVAAAARASITEQGDPSEFALRVGGAVRHILVDEFQDTSLEQFEMLRTLTATWSEADGRTLFLVGDPMQSIYQFREAEVGLFLRARDHGLGERRFDSVQLRRNFRARAPLIGWINERFSLLFPSEDDVRTAAIRYLPAVAADLAPDQAHPAAVEATAPDEAAAAAVPNALGSWGAVTLHRVERSGDPAEARRVLEIVQRERLRDPAASIAVLVASREHAAASAQLLRASGLPVRGVDLEPLRDRSVVRDLAALTRALLHGGDRTAWLALLRAPWCGLTLAQLQWLCSQDRGYLFETLLAQASAAPYPMAVAREGGARAGDVLDDGEGAAPEGMRARLARVCAALGPAISGHERALPLWQRVERCWLRLAGPAIYAREVDRADARRFVQALAAHDLPETLVGEALGEITDGLYSAAPAQPGAIDIMTMHAAKGLEWDVVILPGLGRSTAGDRDRLLHWLDLPRADGGTDLLLAPIRAAANEPRRSVAAYIKAVRRRRLRVERVRLLYVAATRARRSLHLLGALQPRVKPGKRPRPLPGSPLAALWPAIAEEFLAAPLPTQGVPTSVRAAPAARLMRLPAQWTLPPPPLPPPLRRWGTPAPLAGTAPEYRWVGLTARAVGTIVHAELHRLALTHPLPGAGEVSQRLSDYRAWLTELDVPTHEHARARRRIEQALERTLSDSRGRWLLAGDHVEARSEWRLTGLHEGALVSVVFDRMLVDERGLRWVVDFKTGAHEGAGQEEFIEAELQRYRAQLTRYAALARALGPEPVRVALYFPLLGVFRELTPAS